MSSVRVLLIDDEEEFVSTLEERMRSRGLLAEAVTTGEQALARMAQSPFDVVVADLKMPGLGGGEVLSLIKERHPGVRVLLMTGHGAGHGELDEWVDGGVEILLKPFDLDRLIALILDDAPCETTNH